MSYAPLSVYIGCGDGSILGQFRNAETDVLFEYSICPEDEIQFDDYDVKLWLRGEEFRFARVVKTRAYVVVDEADDGSPVVETWIIKQHRKYIEV
jgi:hypothetical protein